MEIQRLSWAGVRVTAGATSLFIDPIGTAVAASLGQPDVPLVAPTESCHVAITHAHTDHYDPVALRGLLEQRGQLLCHHDVARAIAGSDLNVRAVALHEPTILEWLSGDVSITAVPAADGWGDPQVSWIVDGDGVRIIHCGDTLWHGHWWSIARQYGPFDLAFLPINGVRYSRGRFSGSDIPATLTPEQAATAAHILGATLVCPIHYGRVNDPEHYAEMPDAEGQFIAAVKQRGGLSRILAPGETLKLASDRVAH